MKYAKLNPIAAIGTDRFGDGYEYTEDVAEAEMILVRSADMHEMELPGQLFAVARAGAGVNNIPLDKCAEKGIVVFNAPGANANGVKEIVLAGMLLAARDIYGGISWVKANPDTPGMDKLAEKQKSKYAGTEILGKTLGVIGLGAVGALVANAAIGLGMDVIGYDPFLSVDGAWMLDPRVQRTADLDDIYEKSDYITIRVPAMKATNGMINAEAIAKMKDGVVFLNYARDLLVDENAMAEALESGHVRRYMTDFANDKTVKMDRALVTPHLGASTEESEDNCAVMAVDELKKIAEEGNIINSVNFPRVDLGPVKTAARIAICHKNLPEVAGNITAVLGAAGIGVVNMTDQSRGDYAYALIDVNTAVDGETAQKLSAIEGVSRVRLIAGR